jgi:hypothetical protein
MAAAATSGNGKATHVDRGALADQGHCPHTGDAQPELRFLDIAAALATQVAATLSVSRGEDIVAHQRPKRDKDTFAGSAVAKLLPKQKANFATERGTVCVAEE